MSTADRPEASPAVPAAGDASLAAGGHVPAPASRPIEVLSAVVALGASALLFQFAGEIELRTETGGIDPRWWPRTLGMVGVALSLALLVVALVRSPSARDDVEAATHSGRIRLAIIAVLTFVYLVVWPTAGFVPATALLLVASTAAFGGRGLRALVVVPAVMTGALYLLFSSLLKVPL